MEGLSCVFLQKKARQLYAELIAAAHTNSLAHDLEPVYGAVTDTFEWQFYKAEPSTDFLAEYSQKFTKLACSRPFSAAITISSSPRFTAVCPNIKFNKTMFHPDVIHVASFLKFILPPPSAPLAAQRSAPWAEFREGVFQYLKATQD